MSKSFALFACLVVVWVLALATESERLVGMADAGAVGQQATAALVEVGLPATQPGPRLHAPVNNYDWGAVEAGTEVRYTFRLFNNGTETTYIHKARTSCGCGAFDFSREIPPGEEGYLDILIPGDRIVPGRLRATITLRTNAKGDDILVVQGSVTGSR
jgi:hypothetical protein